MTLEAVKCLIRPTLKAAGDLASTIDANRQFQSWTIPVAHENLEVDVDVAFLV